MTEQLPAPAQPAARSTLREWLPQLPAIVALIFGGGQFYSRQAETDRRVAQLEVRVDRSDNTTVELVRKVERVDGKLDVLIDRTAARP